MGGQGKRQGAVEMLPRRVTALRGVKVVGISAGENHTAARYHVHSDEILNLGLQDVAEGEVVAAENDRLM